MTDILLKQINWPKFSNLLANKYYKYKINIGPTHHLTNFVFSIIFLKLHYIYTKIYTIYTHNPFLSFSFFEVEVGWENDDPECAKY